MAPRGPLSPSHAAKRKAKGQALAEARGITSTVLRDVQLNAKPPKPKQSDRGRAKLKHVVKQFAAFAQWFEQKTNKPLLVGRQAVQTWDEATASHMPPWDMRVLKPFLVFYATEGAKPKDRTRGKIDKRTVRAFLYSICSAYTFSRGTTLQKSVKAEAEKAVGIICDDANIVMHEIVRAQLTLESLNAMVAAGTRIVTDPRRMLSVQLYTAIASATGLRRSSILRYPKAVEKLPEKKTGAKWRDFKLWALPGAEGKQNRIIAWYTPRWGKVRHSRGMSHLLRGTPTLGLSAALLLLIAADLDGALLGPAERFLSPAYLKDGAARSIPIRAEAAERYVFAANAKGGSMSGDQMNAHYKTISIALGFEKHVTTHAFRWMVARAVFTKHDLETAKQVLGHASKTTTRGYIGNSAPYATHVPLFEESFTKEELEKTTQVNAVPDPKAPRGLDLEELELVLKDEQLCKQRNASNALLAKVAEEYGTLTDAPVSLQKEIGACRHRYSDRLQRLCNLRLTEKRAAYHSDKTLVFDAEDEQGGAGTVDIATLDACLKSVAACGGELGYELKTKVLASGDDLERDKLEQLLLGDVSGFNNALDMFRGLGSAPTAGSSKCKADEQEEEEQDDDDNVEGEGERQHGGSKGSALQDKEPEELEEYLSEEEESEGEGDEL